MSLRAKARTAARRGLLRLPDGVAQAARTRGPTQLLEIMRHRGIPADVPWFTLPGNPTIRMANSNSLILQRVYWMGERGWEPEVLPWWRHSCARADRVVELGANVGYFTVQGAMASPECSYVAVEPHPESAAALKRNVLLNKLDRVTVVEAAAVDVEGAGEVELVIPSRDHYGAPAGAHMLSGERHTAGEVRLSVPSVDVAELIVGSQLIKLDVEGQEFRLLSHVRDYLDDATPTIFVEVLAHTPSLRELIADLVRSSGYQCFSLSQTNIRSVSAQDIDDTALSHSLGSRDVILTVDSDLVGRLADAGSPFRP